MHPDYANLILGLLVNTWVSDLLFLAAVAVTTRLGGQTPILRPAPCYPCHRRPRPAPANRPFKSLTDARQDLTDGFSATGNGGTFTDHTVAPSCLAQLNAAPGPHAHEVEQPLNT
jgi:hypothetical protein